MEIERTTPDAAEKLRSTVRAAFLVLKKGFSKGKAILHLHVMLKHAGKAFRNLILEHYSAVSCRSDESLSFVSPREYEFSCSSSPAYPASMLFHKRNHRQRLRKSDVSTLAAVKRFLDMLDDDASSAGEPPSPAMQLPGFGKSPMVRQLRITDSPFPVNYDGDSHVDTAAEEFIKNFYRNLRSHKGSVESPYAYHRGLLS